MELTEQSVPKVRPDRQVLLVPRVQLAPQVRRERTELMARREPKVRSDRKV